MTKRNILMISAFLGLMVLLGIGVSYSIWNMSNIEDTENVISTTDCFDISITSEENSISLKNSYPISNEKGKKLTPFTFKVTNTCETAAKYSINLESLNGSTLSSEFLDVMLNNGEIKRLSSYSSTDKVNSSSVESRELEIGILGNKESRDYSLRLWIDYDTTMEDLNNETKVLKSKIVIIGKPINYTGKTVFNFDYTGSEQVFTVPVSGTYKLETWGAQGGTYSDIYFGGYGSYSTGNLFLQKSNSIYLNIGGTTTNYSGGYNGGGSGDNHYVNKNEVVNKYLGGGGATHIAAKSGMLSALETSQNNILIVSGGGGGLYYFSSFYFSIGGHAGGYIGGNGNIGYSSCNTAVPINSQGGTQNYGGLGNNSLTEYRGTFGQGGNGATGAGLGTGGGGGYYGGGGTFNMGCSSESGGGGSGYIGNPLLKNKAMYCYNCEESSDESTKTISTTCSEETPTENCSKKGNGYARITLVSIAE